MPSGTVTLDNRVARQIDYLERWGRVIISVNGPGTVFIAPTKETLEMTGPLGQQQGAPYTAANTTPPKDVPWVGELWAIASAAGTLVDFEIPLNRRN